MRPFVRGISSGAVILCYHGIGRSQPSRQPDMHVPLEVAARQLRALHDHLEVVPLREIVQRHRHGRSTRALAAVTFDDAYESVRLVRSMPDLSDLPITVFATTRATVR